MKRFRYRPVEINPDSGSVPERSTAGACLIRGERLLLEWRPEDARVYAGLWDIPGGHLEPGETPERALVREMEEELGIRPVRFALGLVPDHRDPASMCFYRHYVYIVRAWEGEVASREGRRLRWLAPEAALEECRLNPLAGFAIAFFLERGWLTR